MVKLKYKVGDTVKVRDDLVVGHRYHMEDGTSSVFVEEMKEFLGKDVKIVSTDLDQYQIEGSLKNWTDNMFLSKKEYKKTKRKNIEQTTQVLKDTIKITIFVEKVIYNNPATILFYRQSPYDGKLKKVIAKCKEEDVYSKQKGLDICLAKAFKREMEKILKTY